MPSRKVDKLPRYRNTKINTAFKPSTRPRRAKGRADRLEETAVSKLVEESFQDKRVKVEVESTKPVEPKQEMKLFVFRNVLFGNYTPGIAFAHATTQEKAIEALMKKFDEQHEIEFRNVVYWHNIQRRYDLGQFATVGDYEKATGIQYLDIVRQAPLSNVLFEGTLKTTRPKFAHELETCAPLVFSPAQECAMYNGGGN